MQRAGSAGSLSRAVPWGWAHCSQRSLAGQGLGELMAELMAETLALQGVSVSPGVGTAQHKGVFWGFLLRAADRHLSLCSCEGVGELMRQKGGNSKQSKTHRP